AVGLIGGCTYNDVFEKTPAADRFTGLDEGLRQTTRLNLLVIHGMSTHKPAYSDDWTDGIATKLQLRVDESFTRKTIRIVRKQDRSLTGYLRVGQFVSEKKGTLRIYEVTWS